MGFLRKNKDLFEGFIPYLLLSLNNYYLLPVGI